MPKDTLKHMFLFQPASDQSIIKHYRIPIYPFYKRKHSFNCPAIMAGDQYEAGNATEKGRPRRSEYKMSKVFANCALFRSRHFYSPMPMSKKEAAFPLAYVILLNSHLEQVELLFNAIYAPQNSYCFHVDFKAPFLFHYAIQKLASCFPDQVVLIDSSPLPIIRESSSTLHAITRCFEKLTSLKRKSSWKYALTLQGHDFPLRTNREIVEILSLHDGMNDFELSAGQSERYATIHAPWYDELGQPVGLSPVNTTDIPQLPDDRLVVYKGNMAGSFSRDFVNFMLKSNISRAYLKWLDTAVLSDELYFSTLNHNEFLNAPGGYPGHCLDGPADEMKPWVSRFSVWEWYTDDFAGQTIVRNLSCKGEYRNSVCLLSSSDLPMLVKRPELFLNKFWIPRDPVAIDCMHELLYNRTMEQAQNMKWILPNLDYYTELAAVKYGIWRKKNPGKNSSEFECVKCRNCEH